MNGGSVFGTEGRIMLLEPCSFYRDTDPEDEVQVAGLQKIQMRCDIWRGSFRAKSSLENSFKLEAKCARRRNLSKSRTDSYQQKNNNFGFLSLHLTTTPNLLCPVVCVSSPLAFRFLIFIFGVVKVPGWGMLSLFATNFIVSYLCFTRATNRNLQ